jgi:hypothetical protein
LLHSQASKQFRQARNIKIGGGMGNLKDEFEKLIQVEKENLDSANRKRSEFYERQRERFAPLRATLEELVESIDPSLVQAKIRESSARLEIARTENGHFRAEKRWEVEPNCKHPDGIAGDRAEERGFVVEETTYFRYADIDEFEHKLTFKNEQAVVEYLMGEIAKQVAHRT